MLEHPDRVHPVELLVDLAIVLHADFDREAGTPFAGQSGLLDRDGEPDDLTTAVLGEVLGGAAPPATDVEQAHARFERQLVAYQFELGVLGGRKIVGVTPVAAAVDHPRVEHRGVQIVADVVVPMTDFEGTFAALEVEQLRLRNAQQGRRRGQPSGDLRPMCSIDHLIDRIAVPPTVHVCLAQPQCALGEHTLEQPLVMNADIPRAVAVEPNIGRLDQTLEVPSQS